MKSSCNQAFVIFFTIFNVILGFVLGMAIFPKLNFFSRYVTSESLLKFVWFTINVMVIVVLTLAIRKYDDNYEAKDCYYEFLTTVYGLAWVTLIVFGLSLFRKRINEYLSV